MKECREEAAFKVENYESINLWKETHTQLFSPAYPILVPSGCPGAVVALDSLSQWGWFVIKSWIASVDGLT
jgi:hypothetical protein